MKAFPSKIFIDGGLPEETRKANEILLEKFGRPLDGQTTNPTLIAKNLKARISNKVRPSKKGELSSPFSPAFNAGQGRTFQGLTADVALSEYKRIVQEMSKIIPQGSISIQVFANQETKSEEMLKQARARHQWIPNSSIKLPCTAEGLKTAEIVCQEFPINITLVFSQSQAAAVYEATKKAKYPVFISPFVGRLDDRGECGMDVVANILKMYEKGDPPCATAEALGGTRSHKASARRGRRVEVLTASVRNLGHIFRAFELKSDIITIPFKIFKEWASLGFPESLKTTSEAPPLAGRGGPAFGGDSSEVKRSKKTDERISKPLTSIPYQKDITLGHPWQSYDLHHDLTTRGIDLFFSDWMGLFGEI